MNGADRCQPVRLNVRRIRQKNLCGCGLAALEMVLRYFGANDANVDFLADRRIRRQVRRAGKGLSEGTIGALALKRGFKVTIYGEKPRVTKTFLSLGGKIRRVKTGKRSIANCLRKGVPPIVLIPSVRESYEDEQENIPHYVVAKAINRDCHVSVADPEYASTPRQDFWDQWASSLIMVEPESGTPRK